ncbi:hypothetical protein C8J56DRAFT_1063572 [Mycena floridula]|nr:hypothetical protein C8J56DRAFT_1063572 [Mycena floridula]
MAKPKLYHSVAERHAANAVYNHRHHEKNNTAINQRRREKYKGDLLRAERRQAKKDKEQRLARKRQAIQ